MTDLDSIHFSMWSSRVVYTRIFHLAPRPEILVFPKFAKILAPRIGKGVKFPKIPKLSGSWSGWRKMRVMGLINEIHNFISYLKTNLQSWKFWRPGKFKNAKMLLWLVRTEKNTDHEPQKKKSQNSFYLYTLRSLKNILANFKIKLSHKKNQSLPFRAWTSFWKVALRWYNTTTTRGKKNISSN